MVTLLVFPLPPKARFSHEASALMLCERIPWHSACQVRHSCYHSHVRPLQIPRASHELHK